MQNAAVQKTSRDQPPPLALHHRRWNAHAPFAQPRIRIQRIHQVKAGVDQQNQNRREPRVRNQPAENIARTALIHCPLPHTRLAIRAYPIVSRDKRPAIRAHPSLVHCRYCTVRVAVFETPPSIAVTVTTFVNETTAVFTLNPALVCPEGMVTTGGG